MVSRWEDTEIARDSGPLAGNDPGYVARIRAGDLVAFDALYLAHFRPLCDFAYRLVRSRAVAEELVQDVFAAIWSRRADWAPGERVVFYLYRAVRNGALSHLRHERVAGRLEAHRKLMGTQAAVPAFGEPPAVPDERVELGDLEDALARAIGALPERQRLALSLRVRGQLSYAEIAEVMGISVGAATILVVRARAALRPIRDLFDCSR